MKGGHAAEVAGIQRTLDSILERYEKSEKERKEAKRRVRRYEPAPVWI